MKATIARIDGWVKKAGTDIGSVAKEMREPLTCAGCIAYKKDPSEAPYGMYKVNGHPKYYLDCLHCPIGVTLGECSADGSAWMAAYLAAFKEKPDAFKIVASKAVKKLKQFLNRRAP